MRLHEATSVAGMMLSPSEISVLLTVKRVFFGLPVGLCSHTDFFFIKKGYSFADANELQYPIKLGFLIKIFLFQFDTDLWIDTIYFGHEFQFLAPCGSKWRQIAEYPPSRSEFSVSFTKRRVIDFCRINIYMS